MKTILALALAFIASIAQASPYDLRINQRNATDDGDIGRLFPTPGVGITGLMILDATRLPNYLVLGTGLTISSGTLNAPPTDWSVIPNKPTFATVAFSGNYADLTGTPPSAATPVVNDSPARSLVTATTATGYQISSTRLAHVCYEGSFATTSTIGGAAAASVFLETADTNSTTPGDWTIRARQTYSNTITLAIALNQVQGNNWAFCRYVQAGKYVRIRSGSISGTASVTINTEQQEVLF